MITDLTMKTIFFNNPNPNCEKDCRFSESVVTTTAAYYPPVYDKHGNNLNPDGNVTTKQISCIVCGKVWDSRTQYGKTEYRQIC